MVALVISIGTFAWTNSIEKRLQTKNDNRSAFDRWIAVPFDVRFSNLTLCIEKLSIAMSSPHTDYKARIDSVRQLQTIDLTQWFIDLDTLCESKSDEVAKTIQRDASDFLDAILEIINEISGSEAAADFTKASRDMLLSKNRFTSKALSDIEAERLKIK